MTNAFEESNASIVVRSMACLYSFSPCTVLQETTQYGENFALAVHLEAVVVGGASMHMEV